MGRGAFLLRRSAGLVVSVWAVFTALFVYFQLTPYTGSGTSGGSAAVPVSRSDPLTAQYVDWLGWVLTVPDAVVEPIVEAAGFTAAYVLPALVLAVGVGTVVRVYSVARSGSSLDRGIDAGALLGLSVPAFVIAFLFGRFLLVEYLSILGRIGAYAATEGPFSVQNLTAAVWPGLAMAVFFSAVQLHHAGEQLRTYASEPFVKTAHAKGLGPWRIGYHLFRNTAVTLLSVLVTEMYGMVLVAVFTVEFVTGTPGLGALIIDAVVGSRLPLILGLSLLFVLVGVLGTFLQDLAFALTDPRVEFDT
ncbi:MAG: ABC transporter permease subunit [Halobacteriales archaeon]